MTRLTTIWHYLLVKYHDRMCQDAWVNENIVGFNLHLQKLLYHHEKYFKLTGVELD